MAGKKTFESHEDYMRRIRSQPTTPGSTQNSVEVKTGYVYHSMSCKTIQGVADELNKRDMEGWELVSVFWGGGGTFGGNEYGVVVRKPSNAPPARPLPGERRSCTLGVNRGKRRRLRPEREEAHCPARTAACVQSRSSGRLSAVCLGRSADPIGRTYAGHVSQRGHQLAHVEIEPSSGRGFGFSLP